MKTFRSAQFPLAVILSLACACSHAGTPAADAIDAAVIAQVSTLYKVPPKVISHIELTQAFGTQSPWTFVVTKQPENKAPSPDDVTYGEGAVSVCFVQQGTPDCSENAILARYARQPVHLLPGERPLYTLFSSAIVQAGPGDQNPLLLVQACTLRYGNGSCWFSTLLYAYDRKSDRFHTVFFGLTGTNNNDVTRFIEQGPLQGRVIVATPTPDAPYGYFVEVYKRDGNGEYQSALKYRSRTHYADGNSLSVIDSEMPEILRRLGLWKPGQALPVPAYRPKACGKLVLHKGVEWCESELVASDLVNKR